MRFRNKDLTRLYSKYLRKKFLLVWRRGAKSILTYLQGNSNKEFPLTFLSERKSYDYIDNSEFIWDIKEHNGIGTGKLVEGK